MMAQPGREKLTVPQVAARLGIKPKTFTAYVSRARKAADAGRARPTDAPQPDGQFDGRTPWWWDTTIDGWKRAGQGKHPTMGDLRDSGSAEQDTATGSGEVAPENPLH